MRAPPLAWQLTLAFLLLVDLGWYFATPLSGRDLLAFLLVAVAAVYAGIRTWLYAITRHIAANHRRRDHRKTSMLEPLPPEITDPRPDPLERAANTEAASFVERFSAKLDTKKREVFLLAFIEELTVPEVAAALQIPLNTAYTRLRRVRAEFQRALERRRHA